jgi:hypothetical protein
VNVDLVERLLAVFPIDERDRLTPLLEAAPLVERFVDHRRPHRSALHRWHARGVAGVRIEVARVGGTRCVSPRMLATFFVASGEAPRAGGAEPPRPAPRRKRAGPRVRRVPAPTGISTAARGSGGGDARA